MPSRLPTDSSKEDINQSIFDNMDAQYITNILRHQA